MSKEKYTLELSKHELYWLASAWGFTRIPFLRDSLQGFSQNQIEEYQEKATQSLLNRGFIKPLNKFGWQIANIPAKLVRWISTSNRVFTFELIRRNGKSIDANVYTQENGISLIMLITDNGYEFTLFQKPDGHIEQLSAWLNLQKVTGNLDSIILPSPMSKNLILNIWNDKSKAQKYVNGSGQANPFMTAWLENVEVFASMAVKEIRFAKTDTLHGFCTIKSENQTWVSSNNQLATFSQATPKSMNIALHAFFEDKKL